MSIFAFDPQSMLNGLLSVSKDSKAVEMAKALMSEIDFSKVSPYAFITGDKSSVLVLLDALSFFVRGDVMYEPTNNSFLIKADGRTVGVVDATSFNDVKSAIIAMSLPGQTTSSEMKFSSESARKVYERCEAGRKKANRGRDKNSSEDLDLANIISAIATTHNSINLINIWGLTPYQLYNQFARVDRKVQLDAYSLKWAAWGSDPFDFDSWRKSISHKGD